MELENNQEVRVDKGAIAKRSLDEGNLRAQVALVLINHVRSGDGDDAVPEPVGGSGMSNTTGTDGQNILITLQSTVHTLSVYGMPSAVTILWLLIDLLKDTTKHYLLSCHW